MFFHNDIGDLLTYDSDVDVECVGAHCASRVQRIDPVPNGISAAM